MTAEKEQRLEAFERMLRSVQEQYEAAGAEMKQLKEEGKEKTATYRQRMGSKLQLQKMLSLYQAYGLAE